MRYFIKFLVLFFGLINTLSGQENCDWMFDSFKTNEGIIISSEIKGNGLSSYPDVPVLSKINLEGQEVWRIEDNIANFYSLRNIELHDFSELYAYAMLDIPEMHQNSSPYIQIWKFNKSTGKILWKTPIYKSDGDASAGLINYNVDNLIFYNPLRDNNGGSFSGFEVYKLNKITGSAEKIYTSHRTLKSLKMIKDSKGNLIHSFSKRRTDVNSDYVLSIRKINGINFSNVIWEKDYIHSGNDVASLNKLRELAINNLDEIYAIGTGASDNIIHLFRINGMDGSEIWNINSISGNTRITDYKFILNNLYLNFVHGDVRYNAFGTYFKIIKINLETSSIIWSIDNNGSSLLEAIHSFDFDCNGDIYATGYYGAANYDPAAWGIMKINGETGAEINNAAITFDNENLNIYNYGRKAYLVNDTPFFLGSLQYGEAENASVVVVTDYNLENIKKYNSVCLDSKLDDDKDGVVNNIDQCPNTPLNTPVDIKGCVLFPESNLNIQTIGETCPDKNNAQIIISANESYNYSVTLNGTNYNFTTNLTIDNLAPGNYELCIKVSSELYEQCYTITLAEGTTISGKSSSTKSGKVYIDIDKGTAPYSLSINGHVVLQTESSSFSVNALHGDLIEVVTSKACEGKLSKTIELSNEIFAYPNPTNGEVEINLPVSQKEVTIDLYTIQSQLISTRSYTLKNGKVSIDLKGKPNGIYFAKVYIGEQISLKIIKQ